MAGQAPNSSNIGRVASATAGTTSIVVHPEYIYYRVEWQKLRDVIAGQREIKRKSTTYLRPFKKQDSDDYQQYLEGATFYNMTAQTLNGMVGEVFQRDPIPKNIPKKFKDKIRIKFGKDGSGHIGFAKTVLTEVLGMGRYGVLVDAPAVATVDPSAFAIGYATENILDWSVESINGTYQYTRILLREFSRNPMGTGAASGGTIGLAKPTLAQVERPNVRQVGGYIEAYTYGTTYRELLLVQNDDGDYVYIQNVYKEDLNSTPTTFTPTVRGTPLNFIPFQFFGASGNSADVEKSPMLDIADLNISHYITYAKLEWGRHFTALPIYYAPGRDDEGVGEYCIGPSVVWEIPSEGEPPGIVEFKGEGLKTLERALEVKESQIAAIGGRMMPGAKGSESPEQSNRARVSEQALILNALQSTEFGMAWVIRWWLMWQDVPLATSENLQYVLNRIFGDIGVGAREMRVMQQLYLTGMMPIDVVFAFVAKAGWIDAEMTLEEFTTLLNNQSSFLNNPDAQARQRGFTTRQQELDQKMVADEADMQQQEIDLQEREVELMEEAPPPLPPKPPSPDNAAMPTPPKGPLVPKPGKGGQTAKPKTPSPGGQGGGNT